MPPQLKTPPLELLAERSLLFFNGQVIYRQMNGRGVSYKLLAQAALAEAWRGEPVDSGWLPRGVLRAGSAARGDFAVLFVPAGRHTLTVEGEKGGRAAELPVWLPPLVFFGFGGSYFVWALKSGDPAPDAMLFKAPLPNVFDHAGICWGQNKPPKASAKTIVEAWRLFIGSPFNGHAASAKVRSVSGDVRAFLRRLAKSKKKFPAAELLPASRYSVITLDAAVGALIAGGGE